MTLQRVARLIQHYKPGSIEVSGHTDSKGSDQYNLDLSRARADSVIAYLVTRHGLEKPRFQASAAGEAQPVAPNTKPDGSDNPEGRQKNRRVEILMTE